MNAMNRLRCAPEVGVYCSACGQHAHSFAFDPSIGCESPQHVSLACRRRSDHFTASRCVRGRISSLELVTRSLLFRFPFYSSCQF